MPDIKNPLHAFNLLLLAALGLSALLHIYFIQTYEINWDEFFYLSQVHDFLQGRNSGLFQRGHVYLFSWLPLISGHETVQIIAARAVILALQCVTGLMIYLVARKFSSHPGSLFAVLSYFAFSFVITQGTSFRADPIATCFLMASLVIILWQHKSLFQAVAAGGLIALGGMITIKSIFLAIVIGVVMLLQWLQNGRDRNVFYHNAITVITAVISFALLVFLHSQTAPPPDTSNGHIMSAAEKTIFRSGFLPPQVRAYLNISLHENILFWLCMGAGLLLLAFRLYKPDDRPRARTLMILSLALPLLTLLFYRNAYPYYYVYMLAPAVVLNAALFDYTVRKLPKEALFLFVFLTFVFGAKIYVYGHAYAKTKTMQPQKEMLDLVHQAFPQAVPYLGQFGMVSSYPRTGFFMSTWGIENYETGQNPTFEEEIMAKKPRFIIANNAPAEKNRIGEEDIFYFTLKDKDRKLIRENYVPFWRQMYVAGKFFELNDQNPTEFEMIIPGDYRIESDKDIFINGQSYHNGDVIRLLPAQTYTLSTEAPPARVLLHTGSTARPDPDPAPPPLYTGFVQ